MKLNRGTILVVEDDVNQRNIIKTILSKEDFYVEDADCGKRAIDILKAACSRLAAARTMSFTAVGIL